MKTTILFLAYIALGIYLVANYYYHEIYPLDRDVIAHINFAKTVNDAEVLYQELSKAYKGLEKYSGNPNWMFPTIETDFDYIKSMIAKQINATKEFIGANPNDYGYQRFLKNAYYALEEIEDKLGMAKDWLWYRPRNILFAILYIFVGFPAIIVLSDKL